MKTLSMFLVLSTLTIVGCGGADPDAHGADEPTGAATTQSAPAQEDDAIEHDRATFMLPPGNTGAGQPSATNGGGASGGAGTPASTHRHDQL